MTVVGAHCAAPKFHRDGSSRSARDAAACDQAPRAFEGRSRRVTAWIDLYNSAPMEWKHRASPDGAPASQPSWYSSALAHVWLPYAQMKSARPPLAVARTDGCRIILADGRALLDGIASWWTACHGYNHPVIRAAVERQLALMPHVMFGGLAHEQGLTPARRLAGLMPADLDRVFFSDSGSVAVEVAMKMGVQYWLNRGRRGRTRFVAFRGGYHGDTTGAMAVCDAAVGMHTLFHDLLPKHFILDLPASEESIAALADLLEREAERVAGIFVEPLVQGAGGMRFHAPDVLRRLRAVADRYDLLLIFDEIFTGFRRTGSIVSLGGALVAWRRWTSCVRSARLCI